MYKIIAFVLCFFSFFMIWNAAVNEWNEDIKNWLLGNYENNFVEINDSTNWVNVVTDILSWFKDQIFSLIMILSIWVFIFVWIKLATAKWNPEEFKKAWMQFIYAIIWIFFVFMAWWLVKLVSTLSI